MSGRRKQRKTSASGDETNPRKRARANPDVHTAPSRFRNPFGPRASVPLTTAVNDDSESSSAPYHVYVPLAPDQYTYGYTPELTVQQQAIAALNQSQILSPTDESQSIPASAPTEDITSSPSSDFGPLDPTLGSLAVDSFSIPHQRHSEPPQPADTINAVRPAVARKSTSPLTLFAPLASGSKPRISALSRARESTSPIAPLLLFTPNSKPTSEPPGTSPNPLPSSSVPTRAVPIQHPTALPIPKAITDRLFSYDSRITELETTANNHEDRIGAFGTMHVDILRDLDNEQTNAEQRIGVLEAQVQKQAKLIEQLFALVNDGGVEQKATKTVSTAKRNRNNPLNNAIRRCLFLAMGLPTASVLKDAAAVSPRISGGGYIKDPETKKGKTKGKLLRPDWRCSWTENSPWHEPMVAFVREKTASVVPGFDISKTSDNDILTRLEVVFKNTSSEYRKAAKVTDNATDNEDDESDDGNEAQKNRRRARKARKCEERQATIDEGNLEIPADWEFFLQPMYHSTDESDSEEVLDPETDTEAQAEVPANSTRKPWVTHAPLYRSPDVIPTPFNLCSFS
ncbi:hypothetical protein B0H19DRAFT_1067751 [Mycena capillaripes]|nr:hypothetical protein B0H19DRAFT_1067751 [Mycena capillaripes]